MPMLRSLAGILAVLVFISVACAQKPQAGMIITKSTSLHHGTYVLPNDSPDPYAGAITIQGDNITVDFRGVTLEGSPVDTPPDQRKGTGISIAGRNVTIKNATVRGYKIGLIAKDAPGLKIQDSDFSYNYKQHLKSTVEKENEDDWQSYHQNEKDEWLGYGAAMYLRGCEGWEVRHCTVTGGQCALMLMQSNKGLAWNNDFSFNSGVGVGLYRSCDNRIMYNAIDWDVRGFSYGYYSRGQDSAGILVYEQSDRNTFAYNSVTHGGDGFFLWAGQSSMDTGQGGCNDNFVYGNDFSHSPANGIEATFSQNTFANNYMRECEYGVWGGYSFNSKILGNWIQDCKHGAAIEHGQNNVIRRNYFRRDLTGVQLWANANQDPTWGYPKHHDTASHDFEISGNQFSGGDFAFDIKDTKAVQITGNRIQFPGTLFKNGMDGITFETNHLTGYKGATDGLAKSNTFDDVVEAGLEPDWDPYAADKDYPAEIRKLRPDKLKGGQDPFLPDGALRGRFNILVDEWGPYDFRFPKLWPEKPEKPSVDDVGRAPSQSRPVVQHFRILGPVGKWTLKSSVGADSVAQKSGDVPGGIDVTLPTGKAVDLDLELTYTSDKDTFDCLGNKHKAGDTIPFNYHESITPIKK